MKKEKMITRTIVTRKLSVLGMNDTEMVETREIITPDIDGKELSAFLMSAWNDFTPVKIKSSESIETLYGMPESVFIKYAIILPPRKDYNNKEEG